MKKRRLLSLALAICIAATALAGCDTAPPAELGGSTPITDTARLEQLWDVYLLPACVELSDFTDAATLTPFQTTSAALQQLVHSGGADLTQIEDSDTPEWQDIYLWSFEEAASRVELCFGLSIDNPEEYFSRIERYNFYGPEYSPEHNAILLRADVGTAWGTQGISPPGEQNRLGFIYGDVAELTDGSIIAEVLSIRGYKGTMVDNICTVILTPQAGGYRFESVQTEYQNNNIAEMTGTFREIHSLNDKLGYIIGDISIIGQDGDSIFLRFDDSIYAGDNDVRSSHIWKINTVSGEITAELQKEVEVDIDSGIYLRVRNTGDGFLLIGKECAYLYDYDFNHVNTFPVPDAIKAKMVVLFDEECGHWLAFFAGYDVSADGSMFYYSCNEGLFSYSVAEDTHTLLVAPQQESTESPIIVPCDLRLVEGDSRLIYAIYGYEGQRCLNLKTMENSIMSGVYYGSFSGTYYGPGHMVAERMYGTPEHYAHYFDFATMEQRTASILMDYSENPLVAEFTFDMVCPVGEGYALVGVHIHSGEQKGSLYRVRLADMTVEQLDFSIGEYYNPLGILSDGTAVIVYYVNPAECGIVLVGP